MPTLLVTAVAALALWQTPPAPPVQTEKLGAGHWRLTVTVEGTTDPAAAARHLAPTAAGLCGSESPLFGRYQFRGNALAPGQPATDHIDSVTLTQELTCGEAPAPVVLQPAPVLDEAATAKLNPHIEELSARFFDAREQGRDAEAWAMALPEMTADPSLDSWIAREAQRRVQTGAPRSRQVARLTWYQNPPGADPGHYVAVDYVADWERQQECGYLIWFRPDVSTPFLLSRQELTYLPHDLDAEARAAMRRQHCIIL